MPRVSIGMPVYNGAATIERALECLLTQDFADFELLISDNASTDETPEICARYAARDRRVSYRRNPVNLGAAANFNLLVDWARGEYFRWAAHDDMCAPSHLRRCLEGFRDGPPGTVLCFPLTRIIDAQDREIEVYHDRVQALDRRPHRRLAVMLSNLELCNAVMGLIRTDALRKTRRTDRFRSSDVVLLSELAMLGGIVEIPEPLFWRRRDLKTCGTAMLTPDQQAAWFDPSVKRASPFLRTTLFLQHLVSIARLPLSSADKALCTGALVRVWGPRYWRVMGGELKIALRRRLGLAVAEPRRRSLPSDEG